MKLNPQHYRLEPGRVEDVRCVVNDFCCDQLVNVGRAERTDEEVFKVGERNRLFTLLAASKLAVIRPTQQFFTDFGLDFDKDKLLGWALYTVDRDTHRPVVHFVYVKAANRRQGLADVLLNAAGVRADNVSWATHKRPRLEAACAKRGIIYNKYLLDWNPNIPRKT